MVVTSVLLRPTIASDLDFVLAAERASENEPFVGQWSRDRHLHACQHPDERHWIIVDAATQEPVGYVILLGAQDPNQCLLVKRMVITRKGQGFGKAALEQVLHQAFLELQAHRVWLDVMEDNSRAYTLYRKLGFVEEGKMRECMKKSRGFVSLHLMSVLRSEFMTRQGAT
ncbi:MAG: GNAT family N-acetyltransferase [Leptolyngbya sp. SIO1D8]|nr:GNAT family N-acetyltransferase [Leptolyngbya sp. SIO1D8]